MHLLQRSEQTVISEGNHEKGQTTSLSGTREKSPSRRDWCRSTRTKNKTKKVRSLNGNKRKSWFIGLIAFLYKLVLESLPHADNNKPTGLGHYSSSIMGSGPCPFVAFFLSPPPSRCVHEPNFVVFSQRGLTEQCTQIFTHRFDRQLIVTMIN